MIAVLVASSEHPRSLSSIILYLILLFNYSEGAEASVGVDKL